ncbi:hypothetical protein QAD02_021976 [Eretmocerus hayati]|uniref:Uncharacterized protein n=1 Tax=Eretmocerus hayati TaxID=131215 RepID=A0ACC2PS01_9HYME|nr:hypothetical protein QAD02_021976 [Eretmocerus hayati]
MHSSASNNNPDYPTEAPRMTDPVRRDSRARQGMERNRSQIDRFPAEIITVPAIEKKPQPPSSQPRGCEGERKQSTSLVRLSEGCKETGPSIASAIMSQPPDVMSPDCEGEFCLFNRSSHTLNGSAGNNKQFTLPELESPGDPQFGKLSEESNSSKDCSVALAMLEETRERSTPLMRERVQPTTCTQEFPLPESGHDRVERTVETESASKPTLVQKISIKNPSAQIGVLMVKSLQFSKDQLLMRKDNLVHFISLDFIAATAICKQLVDMEFIDLEVIKTQKIELGTIVQTTTPSNKYIFTIFLKESHTDLPSSARFIFYMGKLKKSLIGMKIKSISFARNGDGMAAELKIKLEVEPVTPPTSPSSEDSIPLVNKVDDRPIEEYEKGSSHGSLESPELRCFDSTGNGPEVPPEVSKFVEEYEDHLIWGDLEDGTQGPQPASQLT